MYFSLCHLAVVAFATTAAAQTQYTSTASSAVAKARATALTESPTSHVVGKTFNRFVTIWLENTDYSVAAADREKLLPTHFLQASPANILSQSSMDRQSRHNPNKLPRHNPSVPAKLCRRSRRVHARLHKRQLRPLGILDQDHRRPTGAEGRKLERVHGRPPI